MILTLAVWLFGLAVTVSAAEAELFYGKNAFSKLLVSNVMAKKNCACNGTWDPTAFADIADRFGTSLAQVLAQKAKGQIALSPISVGQKAYTLSADFSESYSHPSISDATVWSRLISDMLLVGNHTRDHSIITGEYVNTAGGTHAMTLTVFDNVACSGLSKPCEKESTNISSRAAIQVAGPGLDWSDAESVKKELQLPIYNSTTLHEMFNENETLPEFVYLEDSMMIVDTSTIHTKGNNELEARQGCPNTYYDAYSIDGSWSNWGNWLPVSNCLYTSRDHSGGSLGFTWGFQISYAQSFGWSGPEIIKTLSPSFSFSITETYFNSNTYSCNVPGNSVGQVWFQNLNGYGYVYKQSCHNAGACGVSCGGRQGPNYTGAPGRAATNFGCSTGRRNVACTAYNNWAQYSVWSSAPSH